MVMGSKFLEEARDYLIGKQKQKRASSQEVVGGEQKQKKSSSSFKEKSKDEYVGPDTSSLTAFLLSLLSFSESRGSNDKETSEDERDGNDSEEEENSVTSDIQGKGSHSSRQLELQSVVELGDKGVAKGDSPGTSGRGDDFDADWQIVSENDLLSSKLFSDSPIACIQDQQQPLTRPMKLPSMFDQSSLLTESLRSVLYTALPTLAQGRQWVLLYSLWHDHPLNEKNGTISWLYFSTLKHGISLRTLYRNAMLIPGPCLLVAGDRLGAIFGGLLSSPLKPTLKKKYQGTSESFVFTNVTGSPQVFRPTGVNRYYVLCTNDALAFGGGGHFALHIDSELLYGTSARCETYGNLGLASTEDFLLKDVELWGFAHASRYVPLHSTFRQPELVHHIYNW